MIEANKIYNEPCLDFVKRVSDGFIDCVVTSPPYWGLRQYLFDKALIMRYNLTEKEKRYVEMELKKYNVKPRM